MKIFPGKTEHVWDSRTLQFANFMHDPFPAPTRFDFDKGRIEIPESAWGSNYRRCDVVVSQANQLLRFGRVEQKRTIPLTTQDVIKRYEKLAGVNRENDESDIGLSALHAMKNWHRSGWKLKNKNYKILAYGEIDPTERQLVRTAIYALKGIHFGFWLPAAVDGLTLWDYRGENTESWKPGSLGGVMAYCKAYNERSYQLIFQGRKVTATNEFVERYSDEAWACIEEFSFWVKQALDVEKLASLRPSLARHLREGIGEE